MQGRAQALPPQRLNPPRSFRKAFFKASWGLQVSVPSSRSGLRLVAGEVTGPLMWSALRSQEVWGPRSQDHQEINFFHLVGVSGIWKTEVPGPAQPPRNDSYRGEDSYCGDGQHEGATVPPDKTVGDGWAARGCPARHLHPRARRASVQQDEVNQQLGHGLWQVRQGDFNPLSRADPLTAQPHEPRGLTAASSRQPSGLLPPSCV